MSGRRIPAKIVLFTVLTLALVLASPAAPPVLDYLFPACGRLDSSVSVEVGGKSNAWPLSAWTDAPGLVFTPAKTNGGYTARIGREVPPGPHLVRFYNHEGASPPRVFVAGLLPELFEAEPNDSRARAQEISALPVLINGKLGQSGDVDSFAFNLEEGKWLVAQVDGFGLGSPIDPFLHLLDADGHRIAFANDTTTFDPLLAWHVRKSGRYILQLAAFAYPPAADVRFAGNDSAVYRLTITDGPYVHHTFPAGARRGQKTTLTLAGWNLPATTAEVDLTGKPTADFFSFMPPGAIRPVRLAIGDDPEIVVQNPPSGQRQPAGGHPTEVVPPCVVNGLVNPAGTEDRYAFAAKKGGRFEILVLSAALGFPLDGFLKVEDQTGKTIAQNDDASEGMPDPLVLVTSPTDGRCVVGLSDLKHRGGLDYVYRLRIRRPELRVSASVEQDSFILDPGATSDLKISVSQSNGNGEKLHASIRGLPDGVEVQGGEIPKDGGAVKLTLKAQSKVMPFSGPIQVVVSTVGVRPERAVAATFRLKDKESPSDLLINETADLWLTVRPSAASAEAKTGRK